MKLSDIAGILREMEVYHGSDAVFDKFDVNKIGSSSGIDKGGWGIYFTSSKEVASQYISGRGEVRSYRIPNGPYFDFGEGLDPGFAQRIYDELEEAEVSEDNLEQFRTDFMDEGYVYDTTYEQVYDWLGYVMGSRKSASMFLSSMGYAGNVYSDRTDPDVKNYVVYDVGDIR